MSQMGRTCLSLSLTQTLRLLLVVSICTWIHPTVAQQSVHTIDPDAYISVVLSTTDDCAGSPRAISVPSHFNSTFNSYSSRIISVYAVCDGTIVRANIDGTQVNITTIYRSSRCAATARTMSYTPPALSLDERTGLLYVSCGNDGIFAIDEDGRVTNVTAPSDEHCPYASQLLIHPNEAGVLFATCESFSGSYLTGLYRLNVTGAQFADSNSTIVEALNTECYRAADILFYTDNGHAILLVACSGVMRFNLTDRSTSFMAPTLCPNAASLARDTRLGTVFASCVLLQNHTSITKILSIPPSGISATFVSNHTFECDDAKVTYDQQSGALYVICSDNPPKVVGIIDGRAVPLASDYQCGTPLAIAMIPRGLLISCDTSIGGVTTSALIRISSTTTTLVISPDGCSEAYEVFVDPETEAVIYRCKEGLFALRNGDVTLLAQDSDCPSARGITKQFGQFIAACASTDLMFIDPVARSERMMHAARFGCTQISDFKPSPFSEEILYVLCQTVGVLSYNFTSNLVVRVLDASPCGYIGGFDMDATSRTLYFTCANFGMLKFDIGSRSITTLINNTYCPFPVSVFVTAVDSVFVNCLFNSSNLLFDIVAISNGASRTVNTNPPCSSLAITGFSASTKTVTGLCLTSGRSLVAFNPDTEFSSPIVSSSSCSDPWSVYLDAASLFYWVSCFDSGFLVTTSTFRCPPGFEWTATGTCNKCASNSYRPFDGKPFGKCLLCPSGFVAPNPGSTSCVPCPAGSYDSKKTCLPCQAGKYQNSSGTDYCLDCDAGSYTDRAGSTACTPCPSGLYSAVNGSASCLVCNSGSASNVIGRDRPCDGCPAGSYQPGIGQTQCLKCPKSFYSEQANSTSCTRCASQVNSDQTSCTIVICSENSQFNEVIGMCERCPLTQFSSRGGKCSPCPYGSYTPGSGSGCAPCDSRGLMCVAGVVTAQPGFWVFPSPTRNWTIVGSEYQDPQSWPLYDTVPCPLCPGTALQFGDSLNSSSAEASPTYCLFPRMNSASNTMCRSCEPGYIPWGNSCVVCDSTNGGLVMGYLVLSFCVVLFLLYSATSTASAGALTIFLFFLQTASLELGPVARYLDWIAFANLDSKSSASCIAPWSPYDQTLFALLTPIILIGELIVVACVHYTLRICMSAQQSSVDNVHSSNSVIRIATKRIMRFSWSEYGAGAMGVLLFCYTQVATASIRYLDCVDVGFERVNFSSPSIDCHSGEYRKYLVAVLLAIIVYIIGLPCMAFVVLWRRRKTFSEPASAAVAIPNGVGTHHDHDQSAGAVQPSVEVNTWFPFHIMYHPRAWYFQCMVLLRRAAFVLAAVLLMQQPAQRYMTFALLHFASLLVHLYAKPYVSDQLNQLETVSYILLVTVSQLLTGYLAPYPLHIQLFLFFLIVPPAIWMFGCVLFQRYQQWQHSKRNKNKGPIVSPLSNHSNGSLADSAATAAASESASNFDVELSSVPRSVVGRESILPVNAADSEQTTL